MTPSTPSREAPSAAGSRQQAGSPTNYPTSPHSPAASPARGRGADRSPIAPRSRSLTGERGRQPDRERTVEKRRRSHSVDSFSPPPVRRPRYRSPSLEVSEEDDDGIGYASDRSGTTVESDSYGDEDVSCAPDHEGRGGASSIYEILKQGKNRGREPLPEHFLAHAEANGGQSALLVGGPNRPALEVVNKKVIAELYKFPGTRFVGLHKQDVGAHPDGSKHGKALDGALQLLTAASASLMSVAGALANGAIGRATAADYTFILAHAMAGELAHIRRANAVYGAANVAKVAVSMTSAMRAVTELVPHSDRGGIYLYDKKAFDETVQALQPKKPRQNGGRRRDYGPSRHRSYNGSHGPSGGSGSGRDYRAPANKDSNKGATGGKARS